MKTQIKGAAMDKAEWEKKVEMAEQVWDLSIKIMDVLAKENAGLDLSVNALALCVATAAKLSQLPPERFTSDFLFSMEGMRDFCLADPVDNWVAH